MAKRNLLPVLAMAFGPCLALLGAGANAQQRNALAPPENHEVGRITRVIAATAEGSSYRGYVLDWRSTQVVVSGPAEDARSVGENLDIRVNRSDVNGHKVLRFSADIPAANDEADRDSASSSAEISQGTAPIESSMSATADGYAFVGYFVSWHGQQVFVVDPLAAPARANGETLNFRVIRTGSRLSFSL